MVGIAQLVRASVCGTEGRGFEPHYLPLMGMRGQKTLIPFYFYTQILY